MKLIKNGLSSIVIYGCGLIVVNGLSFLMLPFYTRHFIPEEYAFITLLLTCLPFTRYCLPLEISQAAPVFSSDNPAKVQNYVSIGFWFTLVINLCCYLLFYLINPFFHFVNLSSLNQVILFLLLSVDCLFYFSSNILRWQLKHFLYNLIISSVAILEVLLIFLFVLYFKFSIFGVFYAWLISRALGFLAVYIITRNFYAFIFNFADLKSMLSFSFPLVLSNIPYNLNRGFDRWLIAKYMGLSAVGIYGAGSIIGGVINFIMASISASLTPFIYKNHEKKEAPIEIAKLFYVVISFCLLIALFFALFNKEILHLLVAKEYYLILSKWPIVPVFVLAAIFSGLFSFFPGLSIKRKTGYVVWFNILSLAINVILSFLLVHKLGIFGVALAMCISMFSNTLLYIIFSQKHYPIAFKWNHFLPLILLFVFGYVGGIYLGIKSDPFIAYSFFCRSVYCLLISAICSGLIWKIFRELSKNSNNELVSSYHRANG